MAYGIIRVRNLAAGELRMTEIHNGREYEKLGKEIPANIDAQKCKDGYHSHEVIGDKNSISQAVNDRLKELGINPRKNSVVALEYVVALTGTPEEKAKMRENYDPSAFLSDATRWITEKHGGFNNLIAVSKHYDESNPHAHIIVLPIVEKTVKWKNQKGSGERTEARLCARDYTGGPDLLRKLQDDYHSFVEPYGKRFGIKFYRGTKKEEQLKEYTRETSHELGILRQKIDLAKTEAEAKVVKLELEAKKGEFEKKQGVDGRIIEHHKKENGKDDNWKQKKDFGLGF